MELKIPARISASASEEVRRLALAAFLAAGCEGLARVDFFVDGERVLLNELNTMPGFTPTSVYAKLLAASGVPYPRLLDRLCRLALERHAAPARARSLEQRQLGDASPTPSRAAASSATRGSSGARRPDSASGMRSPSWT